MGYHRSLPRCMVFAPRAMGGIGLCHLQHEMEAQQILLLLCHLWTATPLGKAIETIVRYYQIWSGLKLLILRDTHQCSWIPDCWLSWIWRTLHESNIQILHDTWNFPPIRQYNHHIMDILLQFNYTMVQLWQLNACRMYLQVTTLVEITDHTGTQLLPQALPDTNPQQSPLHEISQSLLQWPEIHCPTAKCWKFWTSTIKKIFTGSTNGDHLQQKLGTWHASFHTYRFWKWRYSTAHWILYQPNALARPRVALITQTNRTHWVLSAMIPTNLNFAGPPITPMDKYHHWVHLPIPLLPIIEHHNTKLAHKSLTNQLRSSLPLWQKPLFGPIRRLHPTNHILHLGWTSTPISVVSDA